MNYKNYLTYVVFVSWICELQTSLSRENLNPTFIQSKHGSLLFTSICTRKGWSSFYFTSFLYVMQQNESPLCKFFPLYIFSSFHFLLFTVFTFQWHDAFVVAKKKEIKRELYKKWKRRLLFQVFKIILFKVHCVLFMLSRLIWFS